MSFDVPVLVEAAGFDTALQFFEIEAGRSFRERRFARCSAPIDPGRECLRRI